MTFVEREQNYPTKRPVIGGLAIGDHVVCDAKRGAFRPCIWCGSNTFTVALGKGPHVAQLRCDECGCGGRWLKLRYLQRGKRELTE
jgi:hypothetical protein